MLIIMTRDELWTSAALLVDGLVAALRRFRKSHHLIPAGPGGTQKTPEGLRRKIAVGSDVSMSACCVCTSIVAYKGKVETACPSSKASLIPGTIRLR
jgi:hypothetical protein